MTQNLMRVQVHNHGLADEPIMLEHTNRHGDIRIDTKPTAHFAVRVVETAANVDGPAVLEREACGQYRAARLESSKNQ